jgi:hypothetical protein
MELNITHLKYKPKSRDWPHQRTSNNIISWCVSTAMALPPSTPAWHATEGITEPCQPQYPDIGLCSQCQDSQHGPLRKQQAYQQDIQQWYLEWEPQWEDEHQVRMPGLWSSRGPNTDPPGPTPRAPAKPQRRPPQRQGQTRELRPHLPRHPGERPSETYATLSPRIRTHTQTLRDWPLHYPTRTSAERHTQEPPNTNRDYTADIDHESMTHWTHHRDAQPRQSPNPTPQLPTNPGRQTPPGHSPPGQTLPEELAHLLLRYKQGTKVQAQEQRSTYRTIGPPPQHLPDPTETHTWTHPRKVCQPPQLPPRHDQDPGVALKGTNCLEPSMMHTQPDGQGSQWPTQNMNQRKCTKLSAGQYTPVSSPRTPPSQFWCLPALEGRQPHCLPQVDKDLPLPLQTPSNHTQESLQIHPPETNTMGQEATSAGNPDWDINLLLVGNPQGFEAAFGPHPEVTTAALKTNIIKDINAHSTPRPPDLVPTHPLLAHRRPTSTHLHPPRDPIISRPNSKVLGTPQQAEQLGPPTAPHR